MLKMKSKILILVLYLWIVEFSVFEGECQKIKCNCSVEYCPPDHKNGTCETDGSCFSQVKIDEHTNEIVRNFGCLPPEPSGKVAIFHCKHDGKRRLEEINSVLCCHDYDFCNVRLRPTFKPTAERPSPSGSDKISNTLIALTISVCVCFVIFIIVVTCCWCRYNNSDACRQIKYKGRHIVSNQQTIDQLLDMTGPDSGFGLPKLMQRTIARQMQLIKLLATGQFSRVYEAKWRNDKVAVRVFQSRDEFVWLKECKFYEDMRRHDNILAFIASDRIGKPSATELYLIIEYCPYGSLFDYLRCSHCLNKKEMLRLTSSLASGLVYLHTEVIGTYKKCAIAHRNLTSRGIYVKKGGVCAIGDFTLAVKSDCELTERDAERNPKQPAKRYMAPELLNRSVVPGICPHVALLKADVYSLSLVMWEIAFRTECEGIREPFQLAYQDMVSPNPTVDELRKVVCIDRRRPLILNRWYRDEIMRSTSRVIEECWHQSPDARLPALRVQKTLTKIQNSLLNVEDSVQHV